ncbi:MAG: hypothetical protein QNJ05_11770 [Woeseiaceae bacterium]|nr:hypothetical protein [Woeseiaceae bacterium]
MDDTFSYNLDSSEGFLRVTLRGVARHADVITVLDAITEDGTFLHPRRLWDIRDCDLDLTYDELTDLGEGAKPRNIPDSRGAILASKDVTFGVSRIHSVFRESENMSVMVFRDEDEAVSWLTS